MSSIDKLKSFFKKNTLDEVKKLEHILDLNLEILMGISPIHAKNLEELGITTIKDLAQISDEKKINFARQIGDLPEKVLDKWIRTTTMIYDYCTRATEKKIIILGLDNAGKTSILSILQKKFSIIKNLLPTRGVSRQTLDFLGVPVIAWDFGGQIAYRNMYLSRPDLFLESDLLIFTIDVLDTMRYDEALEYLFEIMKTIKQVNEDTPIIIDMHKFDPDVQDSEDLLKKRAELIDIIATRALKMNFTCTFINTTIFIKETVEELFSLAEKYDSISVDVIGSSYAGRDLIKVNLKGGNEKVVITSGLHGDEPAGDNLCAGLLDRNPHRQANYSSCSQSLGSNPARRQGRARPGDCHTHQKRDRRTGTEFQRDALWPAQRDQGKRKAELD